MPVDGENVTIPGEWTIIMDVQPAVFETLIVNGDIILDDTIDINITADNIWIRAGSIKAGSKKEPFTHLLTFQINGNKSDKGIIIDPELTGNKLFVISGKLHLYASTPSTVWSKLREYATAGSTSIKVLNAGSWAVGDQLVIAPSFHGQEEFEKVTITAISGTTITFAPALEFDHYGANDITLDTKHGDLDARAGVGHITRNIKVVSGPDSGWGYNMVVYGFIEGNITRTGNVIFSGV